MKVEPLRVAAQASGKLVGAAVPSNLLGDARYGGVLGRHFNYLTAEYEMKWDAIERTQGSNDFSGGDAIVSYGQANGMQIKAHTLIRTDRSRHGSERYPPWTFGWHLKITSGPWPRRQETGDSAHSGS